MMVEQPKITIGVWFYAEPRGLHATLSSLRAHTHGPDNLVVLGDGVQMSRDEASQAVQLSTDRPLGAPACFNRLMAYDDAEVIVFLESGTVVTPGWLDRLLETLHVTSSHGLAGPSTNRAWNAQQLGDAPGGEALAPVVETYAAQVGQRYQSAYRTLEPLYSLADFCYVVKREVIEAIGGADEHYGLGPCWEMDYNIRAARAGFKGVWACGAYVHRWPPASKRLRYEARYFDVNRRRYQAKFCRLQLKQQRPTYCSHCEGEACAYFAPPDLLQLRLPVPPSPPGPHVRRSQPVTVDAPLVSCIMPTYNRRPFVAQAIQYFVRQDYPHRELLIVDDGTDAVQDLVPDLPNLRYIRLEQPRTLGVKRNLACQEARGEIIVHWDDDDWMAPWRLRYQVESLCREQADICGLDTVFFYDPQAERAWQYRYPKGGKLWVAGGTLCYTKTFWQRHPFADINVGEDTRFVWSSVAKRLIALQDSTFYVALIHPGNTSPKRTADGRWHPYPTRELQDLVGADHTFYAVFARQKQRRRTLPGVRLQSPTDAPLVSCIMPTYNRRRFVSQALSYFLRQDYLNRELIVVDDGTEPVGDLLPQEPCVRYLRLPRKHSIGAKRNLACETARGDVIVCWDDDDWYAPHRISYQIAPLLEGRADVTGLDRGLLFCLPTRQFWTYTSQLHTRMFAQGIVGGTLTFWKRLWHQGARFPDASLAEDAAFLHMLLRRGARLERLVNSDTFIYVRHDNNSWRFTPGQFLDRNGWQQVELPSFISEPDAAFYGVCEPAAHAG